MSGRGSTVVESVRDVTDDLRSYLGSDPLRNAFVLHDLSHEPVRTELWTARVDGQLRAHLLVHDARELGVKWVHLFGRPDATEALLPHLPARNAVVITEPALAPQVTGRFETSGIYPENIMAAEKGSARPVLSTRAVRLTGKHAEEYARLVASRTSPLKEQVLEEHRRHLDDEVVYGIFEDSALVSVAGTLVRTPEVWIVGGVRTLPSHRGKGYAAQVTSAVTKEALNAVGSAGLYVRQDNDVAIRVYDRLGYQKVSEGVWIDLGTGRAP
jgi:ribosomal protein S18 acetylase RimI-like enzyme